MLIGASTRNFHKKGVLKRQNNQLAGLENLNQTYKQQIDSLLALNKQMIEKLAGLGIKVKIERTGIKFEAIHIK